MGVGPLRQRYRLGPPVEGMAGLGVPAGSPGADGCPAVPHPRPGREVSSSASTCSSICCSCWCFRPWPSSAHLTWLLTAPAEETPRVKQAVIFRDEARGRLPDIQCDTGVLARPGAVRPRPAGTEHTHTGAHHLHGRGGAYVVAGPQPHARAAPGALHWPDGVPVYGADSLGYSWGPSSPSPSRCGTIGTLKLPAYGRYQPRRTRSSGGLLMWVPGGAGVHGFPDRCVPGLGKQI